MQPVALVFLPPPWPSSSASALRAPTRSRLMAPRRVCTRASQRWRQRAAPGSSAASRRSSSHVRNPRRPTSHLLTRRLHARRAAHRTTRRRARAPTRRTTSGSPAGSAALRATLARCPPHRSSTHSRRPRYITAPARPARQTSRRRLVSRCARRRC